MVGDNLLLNLFVEREVLMVRLELVKERERRKAKKIKDERNYKVLKNNYDELKAKILSGEVSYNEVADQLNFLQEQLSKIKDEIETKTAKEKNVSKELRKVIKKKTETIRNVLASAGILDYNAEKAKINVALDSDKDEDVLVIFSSPIARGAVDVKGVWGVMGA